MQFSEKFDLIMAAFAECRRLVVQPKKTKVNTHLKNHYADLESVDKAISPALLDAGLTIIQSPTHKDGQSPNILLMETLIIHAESGQWMSDVCQVPLAKNDCQAFGSSLTYARRYAKMAIFNLSATDDDGNKAIRTASDVKREMMKAVDIDELDMLSRNGAERFRDDAASTQIIRDAYLKRKTELTMKNAVAFNPAAPVTKKAPKVEKSAPKVQNDEPEAPKLDDSQAGDLSAF